MATPQPPPDIARIRAAGVMYAIARKAMVAGELGKYNVDISEHRIIMMNAVSKAVEEGRPGIILQDMVEAESQHHARRIELDIALTNQRLLLVQRQWEDDCKARAAA